MKKLLLVGLICVVLGSLAFAEETFVYDSKGKRDPLMPLVTSQGYIVNVEEELFASDMNLEGIIFDINGNSLAIINGKVVRRGDNIGSYNIQEIEQAKVVLIKGAETYTLELKKEE
jgi:hypothetical protein